MTNQQISKWAWGSIGFGLLAALLLIFSGYGYQWGWWELGNAFTWVLPGSVITGLISFSLAIVFGFARWKEPEKQGKGVAALGLVLSLAVMGTVGYWINEAMQYPPIHDISTDIENPPKFRAVVPLRVDASNDTTYGDHEKINMQLEAYPDVQSLYLDMEYDEAFDRAFRAAEQMPWEKIVTSDREAGLIEAVDKLAWFGFTYDIVIRIDTAETTGHFKLDVRSVSRIGRSDIGVNAQRIRDYLKAVENQ
jgi:uncharacterized protein (DUF1499 family)